MVDPSFGHHGDGSASNDWSETQLAYKWRKETDIDDLVAYSNAVFNRSLGRDKKADRNILIVILPKSSGCHWKNCDVHCGIGMKKPRYVVPIFHPQWQAILAVHCDCSFPILKTNRDVLRSYEMKAS